MNIIITCQHPQGPNSAPKGVFTQHPKTIPSGRGAVDHPIFNSVPATGTHSHSTSLPILLPPAAVGVQYQDLSSLDWKCIVANRQQSMEMKYELIIKGATMLL